MAWRIPTIGRRSRASSSPCVNSFLGYGHRKLYVSRPATGGVSGQERRLLVPCRDRGRRDEETATAGEGEPVDERIAGPWTRDEQVGELVDEDVVEQPRKGTRRADRTHTLIARPQGVQEPHAAACCRPSEHCEAGVGRARGEARRRRPRRRSRRSFLGASFGEGSGRRAVTGFVDVSTWERARTITDQHASTCSRRSPFLGRARLHDEHL